MPGKALTHHISQTGCGTREYAPVHIKNYGSLGELHTSMKYSFKNSGVEKLSRSRGEGHIQYARSRPIRDIAADTPPY